MQSPRIPDNDVFRRLPPEIKVYLMQFMIHKRLTIAKLRRIMFEDEDNVRYNLEYLKRGGLITEMAEQVYELDRYMHIHLSKYLYEQYDKNE